MNISIKKIRGNEYVYLEDYVKVNDKSKKISVYMGKYPLDEQKVLSIFMDAHGSLELKKFSAFLVANVGRYRLKYLPKTEASGIEMLRYYYQRFKNLYPDEAQRYEDAIYTKYAQGSTAIEGNTLTLQEAHLLMEEGITPQGKELREVYEVVNFKDLKKFVVGYKGDLTESFIKEVHSILLKSILEAAGEYRRTFVLIEGSQHEPPPAFEVQELMRDLVKWYKSNKDKIHPLELAGILHARFEAIHPFADGNGRVGRAIMNFALERRSYPTLYLGLEHREEYLDALEESDKGNYRPLVELLARVLLETHGRIAEDFQLKFRTDETFKRKALDEREVSKYSKMLKRACGL